MYFSDLMLKSHSESIPKSVEHFKGFVLNSVWPMGLIINDNVFIKTSR